LRPWQPQKLYFFSDTANPAALDGKGPQYPWDEVSPSRKVTYGRLALESIATHLTQDYPGLMAAAALKANDLGPLKEMKTRLVMGKSLVGGSTGGDVFEGTVAGPIPFRKVQGYEAEERSGVWAELGGPWGFYTRFWKAHDLQRVSGLFPPQVRVALSSEVSIPVLVHNDTEEMETLEITAESPVGWGVAKGTGRYPVRAHENRAIRVSMLAPAKEGTEQELHVQVSGPKGKISELMVAVSLEKGGLPQ
jgi:hypothetical protein